MHFCYCSALRAVPLYKGTLEVGHDSCLLYGGASAVVISLFVVTPIGYGAFVLGHWFVVQHLISFLDLLSSHWKREDWLFFFCCVMNVKSLLSSLNLLHGTMCWSIVCDTCISWSYSLSVVTV